MQTLDDLVDDLSNGSRPPEPAPAAPVVPVLTQQPLPPTATEAEPAKDYAGQFYPTQAHSVVKAKPKTD